MKITSTLNENKTLTLLFNQNNMIDDEDSPRLKADLIYADYIFENTDFSWVDKFYKLLKPNGIFIGQSDYHSDYLFRYHMEKELKATLVNDAKWKNEWGNHPKDRMHQCYDSVMIYCKGKSWYFNSEVIQVPKATMSKGLNPSGRKTKTATCWIDDIVLTTTSKERVRKKDGHLIRWQKPLRLYDRIIAPFCKPKGVVYDLFMGSGSLGKWCRLNKRHYIGFEIDEDVFELASENIFS